MAAISRAVFKNKLKKKVKTGSERALNNIKGITRFFTKCRKDIFKFATQEKRFTPLRIKHGLSKSSNPYFSFIRRIQQSFNKPYPKQPTTLFLQILSSLILKRKLYKPRSRIVARAGQAISPMKPLHFEVSYSTLTAIYLYPPQKLVFPGSLNLQLVSRELRS